MTEMEKYTEQALAGMDTPQMPTVQAGALDNLQQQVAAMDAASRLAGALCATEMVPKQYRGKPDDGAAAILYGAELGMNATQALQNVMVINGKPGVEARTMVALLAKQGYLVETVESSDTSVTVRGTAPNGHEETSTWTIDRAAQAGYTSNALYKKIPQQMLYAKAATEVCRKIAPHVLMGIAYSTEELRLEGAVKATATRKDRPSRGSSGLRAALEQQPARDVQDADVDEDEGPAGLSEPAFNALGDIKRAGTRAELKEIMDELDGTLDEDEHKRLHAAATARWRELPADAEGENA